MVTNGLLAGTISVGVKRSEAFKREGLRRRQSTDIILSTSATPER